MAFNIDQNQIDQRMQEMQAMPDAELAAYLADQEEQAGEIDEGHLVEFIEACIDEEERVNRSRIDKDERLWLAHNNEMPELARKEAWQAKLTTNEPFQTVQQAKALIRRATIDKPNWFDAQARDTSDPLQKMKAAFWKDALSYWVIPTKAAENYTDAGEMGFVTGLSMALKGIWKVDEDGSETMRLARIEPWKLHRDPDAKPRDAQSGLYCIHEEFIDYYLLKEGEKAGRYQNVTATLHEDGEYSGITSGKDRRYRGLNISERSRFRKQCRVKEFWGDVLDHNGELVLPKHRFTVANRTVIKPPTPIPFPRVRWPIAQFAPIPHLVNFHGYSLIEGVFKLWLWRNNILCLTADQLNFILNQAYEVDQSKLVNPGDTELYPGALKHRKNSASGPAYIPIAANPAPLLNILEVLMGLTSNLFQNGSFVTELLKGQTDTRRDVTKGEIQIKTEQALGVFQSIGVDVEAGGVQILEMIQDVLTTFWDPTDNPSYAKILGPKHALMLSFLENLEPQERIHLMKQDTDIRIRGVSIMFDKANLMERLITMAKVSESPRFMPFSKDFELYTKIGEVNDVPEVVKTKDELATELAGGPAMPGQQPPGVPGPIPPSGVPGQVGQQLAEAAVERSQTMEGGPGGGGGPV